MNPDYPHGLTDAMGHPVDQEGKRVGSKRQTLYDQVMDSIAGRITAEFERRVAALEAHITDLEDRLNERGVFSGDGLCTVPGNPAHLWEDSRARDSAT